MGIRKSFHTMITAALAAGIFAVMPAVSAEVREYEGVGEYVMSDFEMPDAAKQRAKARAEQDAIEQAGAYVESCAKTVDKRVTPDEITTMTNGILKIKDVQCGSLVPTEDGNGILVSVTVKVDIDTEDIKRWLSQNKENLNRLTAQNKDLNQIMSSQEKLIEDLKEQIGGIRTDQEKIEIQERFISADRSFLSNQKVVEGQRALERGPFDCDHYIEAVSALSKAVEWDPGNALAYSLLGLAYSGAKEDQRASENCDKAVDLAPEAYWPYLYRGSMFQKLKKYSLAIEDYTKAIQIEPTSECYFWRGISYKSVKKYDRAIEDFTAAIELAPACLPPLVQRAFVYDVQGDYPSAVADYTMIIDIETSQAGETEQRQFLPLIYDLRGTAYHRLGELGKAIEDYTKAIEYEPNVAETYFKRGNLYLQIGESSKGTADLKKARELGYSSAKMAPAPGSEGKGQ